MECSAWGPQFTISVVNRKDFAFGKCLFFRVVLRLSFRVLPEVQPLRLRRQGRRGHVCDTVVSTDKAERCCHLHVDRWPAMVPTHCRNSLS